MYLLSKCHEFYYSFIIRVHPFFNFFSRLSGLSGMATCPAQFGKDVEHCEKSLKTNGGKLAQPVQKSLSSRKL